MRTAAENAHDTAARLWFLVAITGQLMLAGYVAWFYGGTALQGQLEAWSGVLTRGYIQGDRTGNAAIAGHLLAAVILTIGGAIQLIPQVRNRFPLLHRWMGSIYLVAAVGGSLSGLYLTWIRGTRGDLSQHLGGSLNAVLILICVFFALRSALQRQFPAHRRWVLRLFLAVSGFWFYRVGLFFWMLINGGPVGFDLATFRGPTLTFVSFANSIIPLAVLELHLRAQRAGAPARLAMATVLVVLTVVTAIGIFGATIGMWLPIIRTGQLRF
jgi:hypothetical protein